MKNNILLYLSTLFLTGGCADVEFYDNGGKNTVTPELQVSSERVQLNRTTTDTAVTITCNTAWLAESSEEWCVASPGSNQGNSRLLIRVQKKSGIKPREAIISVTAGKEVIKTITIFQPGEALVPFNELEVGIAPEDTPLTIGAEGDWEAHVETGSEWCSLSETSGTDISTISIISATNGSGTTRKATIRISCGEAQEEISIEQRATLDIPETTLEDGDHFRLSWQPVFGISSYKITATEATGNTTIGEVTVDRNITEYQLENKAENVLGSYVGQVKIQVTALTKDPSVFAQSAVIYTHSLYDTQSGNGTDIANAYVISCARHLNNVRLQPDKYFRQVADIDLAGYEHDSDVANGNFAPIENFRGFYDGAAEDGQVTQIRNLRIITPTAKAGLFGTTTGGTSSLPVAISNLVLVNPDIECTIPTGIAATGGLIGEASAYTTVTNCGIKGGSVKSTYLANQVGGLIGNSKAETVILKDSYNEDCRVEGGTNVAGILGNGYAKFSGCHNTGTIEGKAYCGGIGGTLIGGSIVYSYNKGNITSTTGDDSPAGGIAGRIQNNLTVAFCFNTGGITANTNKGPAGGIVGKTAGNTNVISDCYNTGEIKAGAETTGTGGIAGNLVAKQSIVVINCYNIGNVRAGSFSGAITGAVDNTTATTMSGCYYLRATDINENLTGCGKGSPAGSEPREQEALKNPSTYMGWDFANEWQTGNSDYPYPQLTRLPHQ